VIKIKDASSGVDGKREMENERMNERKYALFGLLGPSIVILFVLIAIIFAPWFSWWDNALSDLGHSSVHSETAPWFNFGLLLSGFFTILYSIMIFRKYYKFTSLFLVVAGFSLQLIATFDEVYSSLHFLVSVLFFAAIGFASTSYALEKKSFVAIVALVIGASSWVLYGAGIYNAGIAVPEAISAIATFAWVMLSALEIYFDEISI
jgi:hypothetical membrane protein